MILHIRAIRGLFWRFYHEWSDDTNFNRLFFGEEWDMKGVQVNLYHIRNLIIDQDDRYRVL